MADDSSKTMHEGADPQLSSRSDKSDTTRLNEQPVAGADAVQPNKATDDLGAIVSRKTAPEQKKETSRIRLDGAQETLMPSAGRRPTLPLAGIPTPVASVPETIRLKRPPSATPQIRTGLDPMRVRAPTDRITLGEAPTVAKKNLQKVQTSRVILLDDFPAQKKPEEVKRSTSPLPDMRTPTATVPETIWLKRPSIVIADDETAITLNARQKVEAARKSETAKIDLSKETVAPVPITQRKTIKIKRTERNVVPRTVTITRPAAADAKQAKEAAEQAAGEAVAEENVGVLFSLVAAATVLVVGGLVYIMAAQALAPDVILPLPSLLVL